ncbi:hypothetical protein [Janthinobacterium sp. P210006]|nr:hypothetical protein [Janthinobacterium sp. P210006]
MGQRPPLFYATVIAIPHRARSAMSTTMSWQSFAILSAVFEPFTLKASA